MAGKGLKAFKLVKTLNSLKAKNKKEGNEQSWTKLLKKTESYKEIFNLFDKDKDGTIPCQEVGTAMRALGLFPSEKGLHSHLDGLDEVDFDLFLKLLYKEGTGDNVDFSARSTEQIFEALTTNPERGIRLEELERLLAVETGGDELGDDEIEVVVAAARSVADPKGFMSIKAVTKLLLPEEKEERGLVDVFSDMLSIVQSSKTAS